MLYREDEQERVLDMIKDTNQELASKTVEFNGLRSDMSVVESKVYAEKKDLERLESEIRDQSGISNKYYQEIARQTDISSNRDLDNRNA